MEKVFKYLSEEVINKYMEKFISQGMTKDDAFTEVYAIDCNMDNMEDDD